MLCLLDKHNKMNPLAYNMLGLGDYSHAVKNLVNPFRDRNLLFSEMMVTVIEIITIYFNLAVLSLN